jgi:propionyl-CoA carboxylase alpha chain
MNLSAFSSLRLKTTSGLLRSVMRNAHTKAHVEKPFNKILIANRGEIACRVIRTARRLGVKTVAIYSEADATSMHVRMADEAFCIGPAASKDSYLRMDRILQVCQRTGAEAIHPGYGFLSENAKFVDMVEAAGIKFIGPSSAPMNEMGDKINSKKIAKAANCFIIPGFEGEVIDEEHAVKLAREVGYPVMIKASAGGGGKGMRVAFNDDEIREGYRLSKAEALSSFGDDRMLIERFIENPHHIEIQVLADTHGNVVAFPERECSVQRRNQKVVEESPSQLILPETRRAMQMQAIQLCKATNYRSAGTVEMLADDKQNFYFLEMNTRLQVEHPITELVSGEDLVEHMLWIAAGKPLPERLTKQQCLGYNGYAIESRVYAEDPLRNFLPSVGPIISYREPHKFVTKEGVVRLDTGVYEGGVISTNYDPMIAKLCSWAPQREKAISIMEQALDEYVVQGLVSNISFLRSVFRNPRFRSGKYSTKFIPQEYPNGFKGVELSPVEARQMVAVAAAINSVRSQETEEDVSEEDDETRKEFVIVMGDAFDGQALKITTILSETLDVKITPLDKRGEELAGAVSLSALNWERELPLAVVSFVNFNSNSNNHKEEKATVQYLGATDDGFVLRFRGAEHRFAVRSLKEHELFRHMQKPPKIDMSRSLLSPMPGTLISISAKPGQRVEEGQTVAVIEAMKMQNSLKAPRSGIVKSVTKQAGAALKVDELIMEFE